MRQCIGSALGQKMACRLFGAKPLSKPMLGFGQLDPKEQTSMKFDLKYQIFIHESTFENIICKMVAILSRRMSWYQSSNSIMTHTPYL